MFTRVFAKWNNVHLSHPFGKFLGWFCCSLAQQHREDRALHRCWCRTKSIVLRWRSRDLSGKLARCHATPPPHPTQHMLTIKKQVEAGFDPTSPYCHPTLFATADPVSWMCRQKRCAAVFTRHSFVLLCNQAETLQGSCSCPLRTPSRQSTWPRV